MEGPQERDLGEEAVRLMEEDVVFTTANAAPILK